jgi:hypothetical protein
VNGVWSWLVTPPGTDTVFDPFGAVFVLVFGVGFVASSYLSGPGVAGAARNPVQRAGIARWASIGVPIFGAGLFFFGVRALQINPLSFGAPIWMVGTVVVLAIAAIRCAVWWRTVYPQELARWMEESRGSDELAPATPETEAPVAWHSPRRAGS